MAMEIDLALATVGGFWAGALPEEMASLVRAVPSDWQAEWPAFLGEAGRGVSTLEYSAYLAGTLLDDDYARVTLPIRELTAEAALARVTQQASALGLAAREELPQRERLVELWSDMIVVAHTAVGYRMGPEHPLAQRVRKDVARAVRFLRDGDLHARFWHWLDRFYYQVYQPWRETRSEAMQAHSRQAALALGGPAGSAPPQTPWLPAQNPLLRMPELQAAVQAGRLHVFFWVEPFGLADSFGLQPGLILLSFAEPGVLYENFQAFARNVAARTAALADPTRLTILRVIRHLGMVNTEIAGFLGLARPTVSVHAKILREAGLIRSYQDGRLVRHEIVPSEVRRLLDDLRRFLDLPAAPE
jgi:DNA-binding transcriptional ArsR family regulator